ncbi:TPA: 1-phosphofructokinase [Yersinia enterocolitica]|uniref:1-phosphofructokinase n=1 Tax=Yersinia intermedia TaxID=631 RepID=UPI000B7436F6|nr:1-phosphofructokinase [Yersinia intermedia]MCW8114136.1 1-phosphofructokinase [Yersinia intermedia]MDA5518914.1 1-phosphofructokinase [Yersinia intermedia]OWF87369.1 1-phosphofructokinase [Yersinia intermedia]
MIYTLTLNTAVDMNIHCPPLQAAKVTRTESARYFPNGKGVNVSVVLAHFGTKSTLLGFFGGFTGHYIVDTLSSQGLVVEPVWVEEPTRINVFINDGTQEYKLVNPGSTILAVAQQKLLTQLHAITDMDYLVISGSLPQGIDESYYQHILDCCRQKQVEVILDISHPSLKQLLKYRPLLIKPNDDEVKEIFGLEIKNHPQAWRALKDMHALGARNILLTLGSKGLYFSNGHQVLFCNAPDIRLVSSACAGDAALAAFLSQWLSARDLTHALKLASATGADVAASEGLGELRRVESYFPQLKIEHLSEINYA